jgi:hypothetical protein
VLVSGVLPSLRAEGAKQQQLISQQGFNKQLFLPQLFFLLI